MRKETITTSSGKVIEMKDVQDFMTYQEAKDYADTMAYFNGYIIEPFADGWTVFEL